MILILIDATAPKLCPFIIQRQYFNNYRFPWSSTIYLFD